MNSTFLLIFFFLLIRPPPRSTPLSLHDALPISARSDKSWPALKARPAPVSSRTRMLPSLRPSDRKSTRLNSSHVEISYAVFCLKKKKQQCCYFRHSVAPDNIGQSIPLTPPSSTH